MQHRPSGPWPLRTAQLVNMFSHSAILLFTITLTQGQAFLNEVQVFAVIFSNLSSKGAAENENSSDPETRWVIMDVIKAAGRLI